MKKLTTTFAATLIGAGVLSTPVRADDVRVVVAPEATQPGAIDFRVYKGKERVWTTALQCKSLQAMGVDRVANMIRAYAQDAVQEIHGSWEAQEFEKQLTERVSIPVYNAVETCGLR